MTTQAITPPKGLVLMSAANQEKRFLEPDTGRVYDQKQKFLFTMIRGGDVGQEQVLADYAATYDAECISANTGRAVTMRDHTFQDESNPKGERLIQARHGHDERGERVGLFASPQGELGPADVHIARGLPGYAAGYTLAEGVADIASPPFLVPNQSDKFWTWSEKNAFTLVQPMMAGTGSPPETAGLVSNTQFTVLPYALGAFVPTELQANADAPLNIMQKYMRIVMDKLKLAREIRVATLLQASGSWQSTLVNTISAGNKWNNGAGADPLADIKLLVEQSYMKPTDLVWSELVYDWFLRSPAIQKYTYAKANQPALLTPAAIASEFGLPKITVADIKYLPTAAGGITYVWGNHVVLLRSTSALATQQDVATCRTFRWTGGPTTDGSSVGGWLVRTYFDPKRGGRGGTAVVVTHYDTEVMTSKLVGGLALNAYQ